MVGWLLSVLVLECTRGVEVLVWPKVHLLYCFGVFIKVHKP